MGVAGMLNIKTNQLNLNLHLHRIAAGGHLPHQVTGSRLGQHLLSILCNRHLHVLLMALKSCTQVEILAFVGKTGTAYPIVR